MTSEKTGEKPTADDIARRLKSSIDYVRDCETRVTRGEIMDLEGLDKNVIDICDAIAALPREEAAPLEPTMTKLIAGLEQLARAMKEQQDKLTGAQ